MLKNKLMRNTLIAISLASCSTIAQAEGYYGGNISFLDYSEQGLNDLSFTTLHAKLGTSFHENLSGELRLGFGLDGDSIGAVDVDVENFYGAYLKVGGEINESAYPYIILGITRGELEASAFGLNASTSETDISYGVGIDLGNTENIGFNLEYISYIDKDGGELGGISFGFTKQF